MGTALTEEQLRLLKKFTRRIVLRLGPGYRRTKSRLHGLDGGALCNGPRRRIWIRCARLALRNEARLQADLRVASMPDGFGPGRNLWRATAKNGNTLIDNAKSRL